jgi:hypothetical protein
LALVGDNGGDENVRVMECTDFRNFTAVVAKAREACANSGQAVADHFVDINEMVSIVSGRIPDVFGKTWCGV